MLFRNSKLTQLLADSLSGQAKVMMFLHVAPETTSHSESVSTLKFGSRVSEITLGQAAKNVERGSPLEVREAQVQPLPIHVSPVSSHLEEGI
jgi:kinesin family member C2/C3